MTPNPSIMQAVEKLGYRVTVGDVASQAGLNVAEASQGLLALAADAGGHLQVAQTGDIVYLFPRNFRDILRNKYLQIRLQEWGQRLWQAIFYLIRISFGIFLIISIVLISLTIIIVINASSSDRNDHRGRGSDNDGFFFFSFPDLFWYLRPDYGHRYPESPYQSGQHPQRKSKLNFFEAVFSFLFGDGNPNANLEEHRWRQIGAVISNQQGAVVGEQIAPYLDDIGTGYAQEYEDYMLPVLTRFNGQPQVSPEGQIVYYFPELQVRAGEHSHQPISPYLEEQPWRFSAASSGQILLASGLGVINFLGALILGSLIADGTATAKLGGLVAFVQSIYWLLFAYGTGFLLVPLVRYFWIQWRNQKIRERNSLRLSRSMVLSTQDETLKQKIDYTRQFAQQKVIGSEDLVYSTETDLLDQQFEGSASLEASGEE